MRRDKILLSTFFVLFLFVAFQILLIFSPFWKILFWAATIAFLVYPVHTLMLKPLKKAPSLAALLSTFLVVLLTVPLGTLVVGTMGRQALELYDLAREWVSEGKVSAVVDWARNFEVVRAAEARLGLTDQPVQEKISRMILVNAKSIGTFATAQMAGLGKNIVVSVVQIILGVFFLFFIFRDGANAYKMLYEYVPLEEDHKKVIFQKVNNTFSAVLRGQFLTALMQGILAGVIYAFLGVPLPFLLGFFTVLSAMIPVVGAGAVWVPVDIWLFVTGATTKGFILLGLGVFAISLLDNFLKPLLIGQKTKLPTLLLFLGLIGGLKLYGVLGLFLGPVLLSVFFALVGILQEMLRRSKA